MLEPVAQYQPGSSCQQPRLSQASKHQPRRPPPPGARDRVEEPPHARERSGRPAPAARAADGCTKASAQIRLARPGRHTRPPTSRRPLAAQESAVVDTSAGPATPVRSANGPYGGDDPHHRSARSISARRSCVRLRRYRRRRPDRAAPRPGSPEARRRSRAYPQRLTRTRHPRLPPTRCCQLHRLRKARDRIRTTRQSQTQPDPASARTFPTRAS